MTDSYITVILALLPVAALMVVTQVNPYHALVIRGILGALAAMIYAVLGAADVALTEALVGTMLAITLYAIAVRSSLVMRLGVLSGLEAESDTDVPAQFMAELQRVTQKYHLRLELVPLADPDALQQALLEKEVHAICVARSDLEPSCHTMIRIRRLYEILQSELAAPMTSLAYVAAPEAGEKH